MGRPRELPSHATRAAALSRRLVRCLTEEETWEFYRLATLRHHEEQTHESLQAAFDARREWDATWN